MRILITAVSLVVTLALFVYGYNCYYLLYHLRRYAAPPRRERGDYAPEVAVHLPIYDERYVVSRLVEACVRMAERYGASRTRIVIIDDSDDDTADEVDRVAAEASSRGYRVEALRRGCRAGFKAGALQYALERSPEEFIAVFDADFLPPEDFLASALPYFEGETRARDRAEPMGAHQRGLQRADQGDRPRDRRPFPRRTARALRRRPLPQFQRLGRDHQAEPSGRRGRLAGLTPSPRTST